MRRHHLDWCDLRSQVRPGAHGVRRGFTRRRAHRCGHRRAGVAQRNRGHVGRAGGVPSRPPAARGTPVWLGWALFGTVTVLCAATLEVPTERLYLTAGPWGTLV